jgi:anthranilate phosphoribosyltransferase
MKDILAYLYKGNSLNALEAEEIMTLIGQDSCSEIEISSFLTVFLMRDITSEELSGFRKALLKLCHRVHLNDFKTIDVCGTGGDGKNTFNISTLTAFIVAGMGIPVAKHGNYGVSSPVGSSNLFEHFGYRASNDEEKLSREIEVAGITFMHAPLFHPAMKYVASTRKSLQTKTFFNMLGPMINPALPEYQMVGVYSPEVQNLYADIYRQSGTRFMIIHGLDGYDEISLTGQTRIISGEMEQIIDSSDFGLDQVEQSELFGGTTANEAAEVFLNVLTNRSTPQQKQVVMANAAAALRCVKPETSWTDCVAIAGESLESGKAYQSFKKLITMQ